MTDYPSIKKYKLVPIYKKYKIMFLCLMLICFRFYLLNHPIFFFFCTVKLFYWSPLRDTESLVLLVILPPTGGFDTCKQK